MEDQLSNVWILTLKELALRKMAVVLWSAPDIVDAVGKFPGPTNEYYTNQKEWRETIESKIINRMSELGLPESLAKQVICLPIGFQMRKWKRFHEDYLRDLSPCTLSIMPKFFWTTLGAIDYKKSTEELLRCDALDVDRRYRLACLYCLEDYIRVLWKELPEDKKESYADSPIEPSLPFCWCNILKGKKISRCYPGKDLDFVAFTYSAFKGYKAAAEYFFQKLPHEEREAYLIKVAYDIVKDRFTQETSFYDFPNAQISDVLYNLLSLMTHEQQMQILKDHPFGVLVRFLDWPWQDLFLKIADRVWTFLSPKDYRDLLWVVVKSSRNFEFSFPEFFQKFFLRTPGDFRKHFVHRECEHTFQPAYGFLTIFFYSGYLESAEVIFRNVDDSDKERLLFSEQVFKIFCMAIRGGRWRMVELCIREAAPAKEDRDKLKNAFIEFLKSHERSGQIIKRKPILDEFLQFLDEFDAGCHNKRSLEDETLPVPKRIPYY